MIVVLAAVARATGLLRRADPVERTVPDDVLLRAGRTTLPTPLRHLTPTIVRTRSHATLLAVWSNEPADARDVVDARPDGAVSVTVGTPAGSSTTPPKTAVAGGCTLTITVDDERIHVTRSFNGIEPLFVAERRDVVLLGNRSSTLSAVQSATGAPRYRVEGLVPLVRCGFYTTDETPFEQVRAVPMNTDVVADRTRLQSSRLTTPGDDGLSPHDGAVELGDALVRAVEPMTGDDVPPPTIGLTGGRDSRLIAATLAAAGIDFTASTHGPPAHPDVQVAGMVASALGVEHTTVATRTQEDADQLTCDEVADDAIERAVHALEHSDGSISAYENLGGSSVSYDPSPNLGGHGGEVLRGGYAHYCATPDGDGAAAYLTRTFGRYPAVFRDDAATAYDEHLRQWSERAAREPLETLDAFYLEYRAGRWSSSARAAYRASHNLIQPFFDGGVLAAGALTGAAARADERLIALTLQRLQPELVTIPFAAARWRYETDGRVDPDTVPASTVVTGDTPAARYNWRRDYGEVWASFFRDYTLATGEAHGLFDVIDRQVAERVLRDQPRRMHALVWSLFTAAVLLSGAWTGD